MKATAVTSALTAVTAAVGGAGTDPGSDWYLSLDRPAWQPPGIAFPLVWTPLYGLIGWSTGRAIDRAAPDRRRRLWGLTAADLALNAGWCWVFFTGRNPAAGLVTIAALDAVNVALLAEMRRADGRAAAGFAPYVAWCGFATALNASIWSRNR